MRAWLLWCVILIGSPMSATTDKSLDSKQKYGEYEVKDRNFFVGTDAQGEAVRTYSQTLDSQEMVRPLANGRCCSQFGPVRYHAQAFTVGNSGLYDIVSDQQGWDGYLLLYKDPFDGNHPKQNLVVGDDDGSIGIGSSALFGMSLKSGITYVVVTAGFGKGDEGGFTNTIDGPGPIMLISGFAPTLGRWAVVALILALVLTGLGVMRLKRS